MRSGHSRLQEDTDRWAALHQRTCHPGKLVEPPDRRPHSAIATAVSVEADVCRSGKADRASRSHAERTPPFTEKWKGELVKRNCGSSQLRTEVCIPLQDRVVDAIARALRRKMQRPAAQVKQVCFPECSVVQFNDDQACFG